MSVVDEDIFNTMIKVENKDVFIDLKRNRNGTYLKISERNGTSRNTVLIPATGLTRVRRALEAMEGILSNQKEASCERPSIHDTGLSNRSIYVTGLPWDTSNDELGSFFTIAGEVVSATVLYERRSGRERSLGCGIVQFAVSEDAIKAITNLNETMFRDRIIRVREDRSPGPTIDHPPTAIVDSTIVPDSMAISKPDIDLRRVYVSSLRKNISIDEISSIFASAGVVSSATRLSAKSKKSSSWVVDFSDTVAAQTVISTFHGSLVDGRTITVRLFSKAIPGPL